MNNIIERERAGQQLFSNSVGTTIYGGEFNQAQNINKIRIFGRKNGAWVQGYDILSDHVVPSAIHDAKERFDAPKCHPRTRIAILDSLDRWSRNLDNRSRIMWVSGAAGSGKSAIAQSTAERAQNACSFFFFRSGGEDRNTDKKLVPTLAYQLACSQPILRELIVRAIENDPHIFSKSLQSQVLELIVQPLHATDIAGLQLLIIDGLDECGDVKVQQEILRTFTTILEKHQPPICVMFSSRREPHLVNCFNTEPLFSMTSHIVLDDETHKSDEDIDIFFTSEFERIKANHTIRDYLPTDWPQRGDICELVHRASGQFIYASTVVSFIDNLQENPRRTLKVILGLSSPRDNEKPFAQLDNLYTYILSTSVNQKATKEVLTTLFALIDVDYEFPGGNGSLYLIDQLLSFDFGDSLLALSQLHSIISIPIKPADKIHFHHKSFFDYATDRARSPEEYFIDIGQSHLVLLRKLYQLYGPVNPTSQCGISATSGSTSSLTSESEPPDSPQGYAYVYFLKHLGQLDVTNAKVILGEIEVTKFLHVCGYQEHDNTVYYLLHQIDYQLSNCPSDIEFAFQEFQMACDRHLHGLLDQYPTGKDLLVFLAISTSFFDGREVSWYSSTDTDKMQIISEICKQSDIGLSFMEADSKLLNLAKLDTSCSPFDFFTDQTRSGKYFFDAGVLAEATYHFLYYYFLDKRNDAVQLEDPKDLEELTKLDLLIRVLSTMTLFHPLMKGYINIFKVLLPRVDTSTNLVELLFEIDFDLRKNQVLLNEMIIQSGSIKYYIEDTKSRVMSSVASYMERYFTRTGKCDRLWPLFQSKYPELAEKLLKDILDSEAVPPEELPKEVEAIKSPPKCCTIC